MTPIDPVFRFCDSIAIDNPLENIGIQILRELRLVGIIGPYERYAFSHDPIECALKEFRPYDFSDVFETTLTFSLHDGREIFLTLTSEPTPILELCILHWILISVTIYNPRARITLLTWRPVKEPGDSHWEQRSSHTTQFHF